MTSKTLATTAPKISSNGALQVSLCAWTPSRGSYENLIPGIVIVSEYVISFIERMFVGPVWPASILVCLLLVYTLIALLGVIDVDLGADSGPSADLDLGGTESLSPDLASTDLHGDILGGIGAMTVRWMNLDRLPLILWLSIFTVAYWAVSYFLWYGVDSHKYEPLWIPSILLGIRNIVIATGIAKIITQPLSGWFIPAPQYSPSTLIGQDCVVSTSEVTESFGQAKYKTDAAPLLLNIRTDGEHLLKGARVTIIAFDADRRLYKVTAAPQEVSS